MTRGKPKTTDDQTTVLAALRKAAERKRRSDRAVLELVRSARDRGCTWPDIAGAAGHKSHSSVMRLLQRADGARGAT